MYINIAHKSIDFYQLYKVFVILLKSQYLSRNANNRKSKTTIVNIQKIKKEKGDRFFPFIKRLLYFLFLFFLILFFTFWFRFILCKNHKFVNGFIHVLEI